MRANGPFVVKILARAPPAARATGPARGRWQERPGIHAILRSARPGPV